MTRTPSAGRARVAASVAGLLCLLVASPARAQREAGAPATAAEARALLDRYCVTCHNERLRTAGLALDAVDPARVAGAPEIWEKVVRKLRTGMMPPAPRPRPDAAAYAGVASYFETALDRAADINPDPGRPAVQRLNRTEYVNAVRDLLALQVDGRTLLPADESGYGFDNIGDVLSVSPGLLERYLLAAAKISRQAVGDPTLRPATAIYRTSPLLAQDGRVSEDLPFGSRGGLAVRHHFPLDAEYEIRVTLRGRARAGHRLEVRLDRERVRSFDLGARAPLAVRIPVTAGTRLLGAAFVEEIGRSLPVDGRPAPPPITSFAFTLYPNAPSVESIEVVGPFDGRAPAETPSRKAIFTCYPDGIAAERPCAERIVASLARRAYRRPVTAADTDPLLAAYEAGRDAGGGFDDGIRWALEALLVSPKFLFRVEHDPADAAPGAPYRITDLDLASRLSFFLWSSIPDERLVAVAARGELSAPAVLERQVRRMLADPRSQALVENFAGQWLFLRNLRSVAPDTTRFPEFDDNLRQGAAAGDGAALRDPAPGGPQRPRPAAGRLHLRQRAAGPALRHPQRLREPLPPRPARRRPAAGAAGAREHPDGDLLPAPHLPGAARQVAPGEPAGRAAAAAATGHPGAGGGRRRRRGPGDDARADGAASGQSRLCDLPRQDRPARVRAGELRRGRPLASR